tara:strand:- start:10293 stop:10625 length:333 start_codon:yes stop_codon:yes gene_type:complete
MKLSLLIFLAASPCLAALTPAQEGRLADAIYIVEGGAKTSHPYGVLKKYKVTTPRQACINAIRTKRKQWEAAGSRGDWLNYLADRYCPPSADPVGNRNWKVNIHKLFTER